MINLNVNNPVAVRLAGMQVLAEALGPVGFARFFQQFEEGQGDYTKEKYQMPDIPLKDMDAILRSRK